jgi:hypothetical protein
VVVLSFFPFSEHSVVNGESLLVVGDQAEGGPFDVELRLQLHPIMSAMVGSGMVTRQLVMLIAGALIPLVLYVGFPLLPLSYGFFVIFHSILYMLPNYVISSLRDSTALGATSAVCRCVYIFGMLSLALLAFPGVLRLPMAMNKLADYLEQFPLLFNAGMGTQVGNLNIALT